MCRLVYVARHLQPMFIT